MISYVHEFVHTLRVCHLLTMSKLPGKLRQKMVIISLNTFIHLYNGPNLLTVTSLNKLIVDTYLFS